MLDLWTPADPALARCTPELRRLLTTGDDARLAVWRILHAPVLLSELREMAEPLIKDAYVALPAEIQAIMMDAAPKYGLADVPADQLASLFAVYAEALADMPTLAIRAAFVRWGNSELYPKNPGRHGVFPKPAELHKLAEPTRTELFKAASRAKRALQESEEKGPRPDLAPEERARVADLVRNLAQELRAKPAHGVSRSSATPHAMAEEIRRTAALVDNEAEAI